MVTLRKVIHNLNFNPIDRITLGYIVTTLLLIVFSIGRLDGVLLHVLIRLVLVGLIIWLAWITPRITPDFLLFLRNAYPLILLGFFYSETDYLNNIFFSNLDPFFERVELWLFGLHPSIVFSKALSQAWFSELMNFGYFSYYPLILLLPLWLWIKNRESFYYTIFITILSFYLFYWFFILFPVAGPQFYLEESLRTTPHSGLFSTLVKFAEWMGEGPTAAFPSSHVGIMAIMAYLAYKFAPKLLVIYVIFGTLICFSTVYIKAHYAVDVIGGLIFAPFLLMISNWIYKRLNGTIPQNLKKFT